MCFIGLQNQRLLLKKGVFFSSKFIEKGVKLGQENGVRFGRKCVCVCVCGGGGGGQFKVHHIVIKDLIWIVSMAEPQQNLFHGYWLLID